MKVSLIERSLDNKIYQINHQNADFDDLPWNGGEILAARQQIYCINNDIVFI